MTLIRNLFLIAAAAGSINVSAQQPSQTLNQSTVPAPISKASDDDCPAALDMAQRHLLGRWRVQWSDGSIALLELGPHPELTESVRGTVTRHNGMTAAVVGDVHEGELTLEESVDGRHISGTWLGDVREHRCAQEIEGTWSMTSESPEVGFTLYKLPAGHTGW